MRSIAVSDASDPYRSTPEAIAQRGGWHVFGSAFPAAMLETQHARDLIASMAASRRLAARYGTSLRCLMRWRADVWAPAWGDQLADGFRAEWVLRGCDPDRSRAIVEEWVRAGWRIQPSGVWPEGEWDRLNAAEGVPQFYWRSDERPRTLAIHAIAADLRIPEYRAWAVERAVWAAERTGVDGFMSSVKMGWHMAGSPARSTPSVHPEAGGVLFESPYGPGEFEAVQAALLEELGRAGIFVLTVHRPPDPAASDRCGWMPASVRDLVLGELGAFG